MRHIVLVVALAVALGTAVVPAGATVVDDAGGEIGCEDGTDHPPIRITGDGGAQGFAAVAGTPTYRPGSGVVAGLGTAEDPYVIEGWCIDAREWDESPEDNAAPDQPHGIVIADTTAHAVVQDVTVKFHDGDGILVKNAHNVDVVGSDVHDNGGNGTRYQGSTDGVVANNTVEDNGVDGIILASTGSSTVEDNAVTGNGDDAFEVRNAADNTVTGNTLANNADRGMDLRKADDSVYEDNLVEGHPSRTVVLAGSSNNVFDGNTVRDNDHVAFFIKGHKNAFTANNVTANAKGFVLAQGKGNAFNQNNIADNGVGLVSDTGFSVDATNNWWGCPDGPDDAACDDVVDKKGTVTYDPWLTGPNLDAGAD